MKKQALTQGKEYCHLGMRERVPKHNYKGYWQMLASPLTALD